MTTRLSMIRTSPSTWSRTSRTLILLLRYRLRLEYLTSQLPRRVWSSNYCQSCARMRAKGMKWRGKRFRGKTWSSKTKRGKLKTKYCSSSPSLATTYWMTTLSWTHWTKVRRSQTISKPSSNRPKSSKSALTKIARTTNQLLDMARSYTSVFKNYQPSIPCTNSPWSGSRSCLFKVSVIVLKKSRTSEEELSNLSKTFWRCYMPMYAEVCSSNISLCSLLAWL